MRRQFLGLFIDKWDSLITIGDGGGTFDLGPALFSIKGDTPSEDDILAKTKQYVDDDILNGKW